MAEEKKIAEILSDMADEICNNYCKYPYEYDPEEHDDIELCDSEICANCPLVRLL